MTNEMDPTERLAKEHLLHRGFIDVVYEPDGNFPPDFVVDGLIAIEVRQLNQLEPERSRGVDETGRPFRDRIASVLASYGTDSRTHWLGLRYQRPLPRGKRVIESTREFVDGVLSGRLNVGAIRPIADSAFLEYVHHGDGPGDRVRIGTIWDMDLGGWVVSEFRRSLEYCIQEKSRKTAPHRSRYPQWWLVLVDHVAYGLSARDRDEFFGLEPLELDWDRVIVVNPLDVKDFFEVGSNGLRPT